MLDASLVGVGVDFYWRPTIEDIFELFSSMTPDKNGETVVIINNNVHQLKKHESTFCDEERRYQDLKLTLLVAQSLWGTRRVFWRTPNSPMPGIRQQVPSESRNGSCPPGSLTYKDAFEIDTMQVIPRVVQELQVPLIDAALVTSQAKANQYRDMFHLIDSEFYQEVNIWMNQLASMYREGYWRGPEDKY